MQHSIITILLTVLMSMAGTKTFAYDIEAKNSDGVTIYYVWTNNNSEVAVSYQGASQYQSQRYSGTVVIPETIEYEGNTYNVTSIGDFAFYQCNGLASVTIPNSVTSIGNGAFSNCSGMTSITIPEGVSSIGSSAFSGCSGLTSITIPEGLTEICSGTFSGCNGLTTVDIPNSVVSIGSNAFDGCNGLTTVPDNAASIGSDAFKNTAWYDNQPDGLVYAGKVTYKYKGEMPANTSIEIKDGTLGIAGSAFSGCKNLTSITIPSSVTSINSDAFQNCSNLTAVYISDLTAWCGIAFQGYVYSSSNPLYYAHHLYLNGVEIKDLVIPNSVTSIGNESFRGCSSLTSVSIPNSVTSIGNDAFFSCTGLTSLDMPNSVKSIGSYAFYNCSGLTSVNIPNSVTSIGSNAFQSCNGLTTLTIPNGVTTINKGTFGGCTSLKSVTIPNGVTSIDDWAFNGCSSLQSITIPGSVTSIGSNAFQNCNGLTSVTISDMSSWLNIDFGDNNANPLSCAHHLYLNEEEVSDLTIPNDQISIGNYVFSGCSGLTSVIIPEGVTSIGSYAFYNCSGLTSINIPNSVSKIGNCAFDGCDNLSIVLPDHIRKRTIHVEKAGTLSNYIAADERFQIEELTLTGELNTHDLLLLREMGGKALYGYGRYFKEAFKDTDGKLSVLDLSGAKIVEGFLTGWELYWKDGTDDGFVSLSNEDDEIPPLIFYGCKKLSSITLPSSVKSIGCFAFEGTTWYDNQPDGLVYLGKVLYAYKGNMPEDTNVTIKDGTLGIAYSAFFGCTGLKSITLPQSIVSIGKGKIKNSNNGIEPNNNDIIREFGISNRWTFSDCINLTTVISEIENPMEIEKVFSTETFANSTLYVPKGCKAAYEATDYWKEFKNIKEFAMVEEVNCSVEDDNTAMVMAVNDPTEKDVVIPESVIIDGELYPVTSIGEGAFKDNTALTLVCIPEIIEEIGDNAFAGCSNLKAIYSYNEEPIAIGNTKATVRTRADGSEKPASSVFAEVNKQTCILYVPKSSASKYRSAEGWGEFQNIVEMESTKPGDANNDGEVDSQDVDATAAYIMDGKTENFIFINADVKTDSKINAADIVKITILMKEPD